MSPWGRLQLVIRNSLSEDYIDLTAVLFLTVATVSVALLPGVRETVLRPIVGLLFIVWAPGWAVIAALFPGASRNIDFDDIPNDLPFSGAELQELVLGGGDGADQAASRTVDPYLGGIERLALSLGVGVAVVALAGLTLNYTPWPIALGPILGTLGSITVLCTIIAAVRRSNVARFERFTVPVGSVRNLFAGPWSRTDYVLNGALVVGALLLIGTLAFTIATPAPDDRYSNFWVLTEDEEGEMIAGNYTEVLTTDADRELVAGVENNEYEDILYVVVVQLQEVERTDEEIRVVERQEVDRFEQHVQSDEQWQQNHNIEIEETDEELRVQYLLYKIEAPYTGTVPDNPTAENADNDLHLWVTPEAS